jgi:hypothetical protein
MRSLACILTAIFLSSAPTQAAEGYKRLGLTVNAVYLLLPVFQLKAELALAEKWGASIRAGLGNVESGFGDDPRAMSEFGAQALYYFYGNVGRGFRLGLDLRVASVEEEGYLMGLGDAAAIGLFAGYKRAFGPGLTLEIDYGGHLPLGDDADKTVLLPYLGLFAGWSFLPSVRAQDTAQAAPAEDFDPIKQHKGFMFGFSVGGGPTYIPDCEDCELRPGIGMDGSIGWFLKPRFALMYDATAAVNIGVSGFAAVGNSLQSLALQYWPRRNFWLKLGVGVARFLIATPIGEGETSGGGMTLAGGYEFHHNRNFAMDVQVRATHGEFDTEDGGTFGVDNYAVLIGFNWY